MSADVDAMRRALYLAVRERLMAVYAGADDAGTLDLYGEAIACLDALYMLARRNLGPAA